MLVVVAVASGEARVRGCGVVSSQPTAAMASQPESRIPGPGGGYGGREKRRSFLPAPKSYSGIPTPGLSSTSVISSDYTAAPTLPSIKAPGSVKKDNFHEESQAVREEIPGASHLKINGKVTIGGVKPGILRYVGKTHIAPGFWCGVELFDASGLHDGELFPSLKKPVKVRSFPPPTATQEQDEQTLDKKEDVELTALVTDLPERTPFGDPAGEPIQAKAASSGKSQIARLSSIPRIGPAEKVVKSTSAESFLKDSTDTPKAPVKSGLTRIAAFIRRDRPPVSQLNSTFVVENQSVNRSSTSFDDLDLEGSLDENYIQRVEKKLQSDSRQYFNITFNKEGLPGTPQSVSNLPDVVSSASPTPSPPSHSKIPGALNQTQSAQDIASTVASDMSLGLLEPDLLLDDTNLLDNLSGGERVVSSTSESDISLSGNSSTLEETSIAIADLCEGQTSTPLQGNNLRKLLGRKGVSVSDVDVQRSEDITENETKTEEIRQNFSVVQDRYRDSDSSSSSGAAFPVKQELLQEEGSNGILLKCPKY
ncbi:hypothetical protein C0Q70_05701 [Pomacea canaliculata]|uniref:CAP-Gly domain-containing protein n=1 Tax=Pomacea canaliculata TaxID=400727 RepID=A0A2T7PLX7_POMCA|nr:hypothetical protein C0Q70_05701 [Pomacea canaliculata]